MPIISLTKIGMFVVAVAAGLLCGCGAKKLEEDTVRTAESSLDRGLAAFNEGDFAEAEECLSAAIEAGGLQPDLYLQACVERAVALGHLGRVEDGLLQLAYCEEGIEGPDQMELATARIYLAAGDEKTAKSHVNLAREANRRVQLPEELRSLL